MKKIKVLHICPGFLYGGIESRLIDWYGALDRNAFQFDVLKVTPDEPNVLVDRIHELGGEVYSIPPLSSRSLVEHIKNVKKILRNGNYDVIHSHAASYAFFPFIFSSRKTTKIIHSRTTQTDPNESNLFAKKILSYLAISKATDYFACSKAAGTSLFGNKRPFKVVKNGIRISEFELDNESRKKTRLSLNIPENSRVIGTIGRMTESKNYSLLIDIFNKLLEKIPDAVLILVGDGPEEERIRSSINEYKIENNVRLVGRQENVVPYLNSMDVFVFPSQFEGFGTVALEAQANGLPCIISTGVSKEVIVSNYVKIVSLDSNIEDWVNCIFDYSSIPRKPADMEYIVSCGFDVNATAKWLGDFYRKRVL